MKDLELTTLYCHIDDFWKAFRAEWEKHLLGSGKSRREPESELSIAEMMTIIILFHQSNYRTFKHFYTYIYNFYRSHFLKLISYFRFVHTNGVVEKV